MKRGNVFDIQRYSIHDGGGIRTVVFLKGCPLRCQWCANPESWKEKPQLFYSSTRCIGCRTCVHTCTNGEVTEKNGFLQIHWDRCGSELSWVESCPSEALLVKGKSMTVAEVMSEIRKDQLFYRESGGGVTLSGGEPLLQPEFCQTLLKTCKEEEMRTAVETTGCVPWEHLEQIRNWTDLFLYDVKHIDSAAHKKWTGIGNERILENLKRLSAAGANIRVRIPVIPGVNDTEEVITAIASMLLRFGISDCQLLSFHQYGKGKYESCGLFYPLASLEALPETHFQNLQAAAEAILKK